MTFDIIFIGFGVIGVEGLYSLCKKINKNKKKNKNLLIGVIEKDLTNIPGGIAYSLSKSKYGFFNNPLRLSHPEFNKWVNKKKNKQNFIEFILKNPQLNLNEWLNKNSNFFLKKKVEENIYLPRCIYSFYLKEKIFKILNLVKKKNIKILYYKGTVDNFSFKQNKYIIKTKHQFQNFIIKENKNDLINEINHKKMYSLKSNNIVLGTGILPPSKIKFQKKGKLKNYIWDFYAEGGTSNLLKKINEISKKKKQITITFIGNKAGLLETTIELSRLIFKEKLDLKINIVSQDKITLKKAKLSKRYKKYKLKVFNNKNIRRIKESSEIYRLLKKEFKDALSKKFNKYDVWTTILKKNILIKCMRNLNKKEKIKYNINIFPLIRNLTRFTYPETVVAKNILEKKKKIFFIKGKAVYLKSLKDKLLLKTNLNKWFKSDIIVNVSGPLNVNSKEKQVNYIDFVKKFSNKIEKKGFLTDNNFMLEEGIFMPGTLAYNFNPLRQTIIKSITNNAKKVTNYIVKNL